MNHLEHCDALEREIIRFSDVLGASDLDRLVPSCPAWSVRDLGEHLGEVHRWAEYLVRERSRVRVSSKDMNLDRGPLSPSWILKGGTQLLSTLRSCDPDHPLWAWGADQHARFWSRRQLHETLVHRIDLELTLGEEPEVDVNIASDAIDEFLVNLSRAAAFSPRVNELKGDGRGLAFRELDGNRRWVVGLSDTGISLLPDAELVDVEFSANALDLLLVLYRRRQSNEVTFTLDGDQELLRFWLAHSALE